MPADARPTSATSRLDSSWWILVAAVALLVHARAVGNGFVFDDFPIVVENPALFDLGAWREWLRGFWPGHDLYFRPLTLASLALDAQWAGNGARSFHLTSIILHTINACLVGSLARRFGAGAAGATVAALAFALHPLVTEAAYWISARGDVLATTLVLAAVRLHLARVERRWVAAALLLAALLAKESAIAAPVLLLIADRADHRAFRVSRYLPAAAACGAYLLLRWAGLGTLLPATADPSPLHNPLVTADLATRLVWPFGALAHTLRMLVWPHPLSSDYTATALLPPESITAPAALTGLGAALAMAALAVRSFRGSGRVGYAVFAAFVAWLPASNVLFLHGAIFGERFLYLALAPLAVLLGGVAPRIRTPWMWAPLAALALLAAFGCIRRAGEWADNESLFASAVRARPASAQAHHNVGVLKLAEATPLHGDDPRRLALLMGAVTSFKRARDRYPDYTSAYLNEGTAYFELPQLNDAANAFALAAETDPADPRAPFNLGRVAEAMGEFDAARRYYEVSRALAGGGPAEAALRRLTKNP